MHVESSAIADIAYEEEGRRLLVTFHDGDRYAYSGVPAEVARNFLAADSKGRFFALQIRDHYRFRKL